MSKNSKFFKEIKKLDQKSKKSSSFHGNLSSIDHSKGKLSISNALQQFISPYLHVATDLESHKKLLILGVAGWNIALHEESQREDLIELLSSNEILGNDVKKQQDFQDIIREMVDRKVNFFSEYKYIIVDFELTKVGNDYQLSVKSKALGEDEKIIIN